MHFERERSRSGESKLQHWGLMTEMLFFALRIVYWERFSLAAFLAKSVYLFSRSNEQFCSTRASLLDQNLIPGSHDKKHQCFVCISYPLLPQPNTLLKNTPQLQLKYFIFPGHVCYGPTILGAQMPSHSGCCNYELGDIFRTLQFLQPPGEARFQLHTDSPRGVLCTLTTFFFSFFLIIWSLKLKASRQREGEGGGNLLFKIKTTTSSRSHNMAPPAAPLPLHKMAAALLIDA